jgi:hypothetical protein
VAPPTKPDLITDQPTALYVATQLGQRGERKVAESKITVHLNASL